MTSTSSFSSVAAQDPGSSLGLHPSLVLSAYLEPLVRGRRVAILGDAGVGLAGRLVERGARLVHAYDPDAARVAEAIARVAPSRQPHPSFAVLTDDLGVRDGAFDAVIVPDLSMFPDPADILRRARRLVAESGAVIVASPNPDAARTLVRAPEAGRGPTDRPDRAPDYYALYDLVSLQFRIVRMLGQAPFVGYAIVDFAQEGDPEISIDQSMLAGTEEPEWFIALASERPVRLDGFSLVELPFAELALPALADTAPDAALAEVVARAAQLERDLSDLRDRHEREREGAEARAEARAEAAAAASARIAELEAELASAIARVKEAEARAGDTHVRAERLEHRIRELDEELRAQRDRGVRLAKQLDDEKKARTKIELELGMIRNKPEIAGAKDRIDVLSADLESARARIAELEARPPTAALDADIGAPGGDKRALRPGPDPALMLRLEELESAVVTAKREIVRISGERDNEHARAEALDEQRRASDEQRRAAEEREVALAARVTELERRDAERSTGFGAEGADRRPGAPSSTSEAGELAGAEIAALEAALRERGRIIAALQQELHESERVGKELVDELGDLFETAAPPEGEPGSGRSPGSQGAPPADGAPADGAPTGSAPVAGASSASPAMDAQALRRNLNTLAESAARSEADLRAATWRIAQLEREIADTHGEPPDVNPGSTQNDLEHALVAAQAEIAALRHTAGAGAGMPAAPPREVIEQSVLLRQVAAAAAS